LIRIAPDAIKLSVHSRRDIAIGYVKGAFDFMLNRSGKIK